MLMPYSHIISQSSYRPTNNRSFTVALFAATYFDRDLTVGHCNLQLTNMISMLLAPHLIPSSHSVMLVASRSRLASQRRSWYLFRQLPA